MKTTTLILSAIIAALPFAANATQTIVQTQTPAAVGSDGTVKKAAATGPYVTNEPTADDQTHIATTAYVKGAYNDAIAAVNKVDSDKQNQLYNGNTKITGIQDADEFEAIVEDAAREAIWYNRGRQQGLEQALTLTSSDGADVVLTAVGVAHGIMAAADVLNDQIDYKIDERRVRIYTTWDDDTAAATTLVEFEMDDE